MSIYAYSKTVIKYKYDINLRVWETWEIGRRVSGRGWRERGEGKMIKFYFSRKYVFLKKQMKSDRMSLLASIGVRMRPGKKASGAAV